MDWFLYDSGLRRERVIGGVVKAAPSFAVWNVSEFHKVECPKTVYLFTHFFFYRKAVMNMGVIRT